MDLEHQKASIIKANRLLQSLVGSGSIDPAKIEAAEDHATKIDPQYEQWANERFDELVDLVEKSKTEITPERSERIIEIVMDLKANGSFFENDNLTNLCDGLLEFLDDLEQFDSDIIGIISTSLESIEYFIDNFFFPLPEEEGLKAMMQLKDQLIAYYKKTGIVKEYKDASFLIELPDE